MHRSTEPTSTTASNAIATTNVNQDTALISSPQKSKTNKSQQHFLLPMDRFSYWVNSILVGKQIFHFKLT